jgi:pimeloyl-ACP methyl ester carboxylesterase
LLAPAATFVLVHGAFQDASAWDLVTPRLQAAGHKVVVLQRPGRPPDTRDPTEITLAENVDLVVQILRAQPDPVILVGHSFAGLIISQAAEQLPARVAALVYVAAYLPRDGDSLRSLSATDSASALPPHLRLNPAHTAASVDPAGLVEVFCADAPAAWQAHALAHPVAEPLAPLGTAVSLTTENFGRVRKLYVTTTADRCVSPAAQAAMLAATPVDRILPLDSSHGPFWSQPEALAEALLSAP